LESLIYLKACLKIVIFSWYVRKSLPFVSRFTSILMLEGSQLNNISLLSVYLSQSKKKWWEFSHGAPQFRKHLIKFSMPIPRHYSYGPRKLNTILTHVAAMHPSWITIYVKLKFYQMLPELWRTMWKFSPRLNCGLPF
jgi:hypothetical protein